MTVLNIWSTYNYCTGTHVCVCVCAAHTAGIETSTASHRLGRTCITRWGGCVCWCVGVCVGAGVGVIGLGVWYVMMCGVW